MADTGADGLLLDTHAWVWMLEGRDDLAGSQIAAEIEAASEDSKLLLASISLWEIAMLESKGRIGFRIPCQQWLMNAVDLPGLSLVPITPSIAADSARLPGEFHGDPADRLIVASARHTRSTLVTRDRAILDYGAQGHVRTTRI